MEIQLSEEAMNMEERKPKEKKDLSPFVPGAYTFMIADVEDKVSMKGNQYTKLTLKVNAKTEDGREVETNVFDNLFSGAKSEWKIVSIMDSVGLKRTTEKFDTSVLLGLGGGATFRRKKNEDGSLSNWLEVGGYETEGTFEKLVEFQEKSQGSETKVEATPF